MTLQIFEERERALAGVRHAVVEHQVGKIAEAEQARLFAAQFQNPGEQLAVVAFRLGGADGIGLVDAGAGSAALSRYVITAT